MDFRLTEDQAALRTGTRELLGRLYPPQRLREDAAGSGPPRLDRALWRALGDAGLFALRLPEARGGVGLGLVDAVLVFEEAGRALLPGPLVASHLAAGIVPGAATGEVVVTAADGDVVEWLEEADRVLEGFGAGEVLGPLTVVEPVRSVDPLTPLHRVVRDAADRTGSEAELLTCAQQIGSAARTLDLAVQHARTREQFGRPIGAFQAIKHLCAEMLVRLEMARTAVYAAAVTELAGDHLAAIVLAREAAAGNARDCLQVFGGMGFTWEAEVHLHIKRAWVLATRGLPAGVYEEAVADGLVNGTI